ncbi:MAG TPA: OmpA family protein, partial [Acidimicrobiales bacterium]|nr:OmpA family protein [Acidimicrobiales bacterium]
GLAFSQDSIEVSLAADVLFAFDSAALEPAAEPSLAEARQLLTRATDAVTIVGHTDNVGSDQYNDDLSLRRAESVRQALAAELAAAGVEVVVEGRGKRHPVAPNNNEDGSDNPEGRQKNRRVTVSIPVAAGGG